MKKLTLILIVSLTFTTGSFAKDEAPVISKNAGLVSYLTQIKLKTENRMFIYLKENGDSAEVDKIIAYNSVLLQVDVLINQLNSDLVVKNKLGVYRKLNKHIKAGKNLPKKFMQYGELIQNIDSAYSDFYAEIESESIADADLLGVIFDFSDAIYSAITDARDFRAKKIESLTLRFDKIKLEKLEPKKEEKKAEDK